MFFIILSPKRTTRFSFPTFDTFLTLGINNIEVRAGEDYSHQPAHLVITNTTDAEAKSELLTALEQIKFT